MPGARLVTGCPATSSSPYPSVQLFLEMVAIYLLSDHSMKTSSLSIRMVLIRNLLPKLIPICHSRSTESESLGMGPGTNIF